MFWQFPFFGFRRRAPAPRKPIAKETKKLLLLLLVNTLVLIPLYLYLTKINFIPIMFIYMGATLVLTVVYVVYNRGFVRKGVKPEDLTDAWTEEEKIAYIEDGKKRLSRSRWMLTFLLPLFLTFLADWALYDLIPYLEAILDTL